MLIATLGVGGVIGYYKYQDYLHNQQADRVKVSVSYVLR